MTFPSKGLTAPCPENPAGANFETAHVVCGVMQGDELVIDAFEQKRHQSQSVAKRDEVFVE